MWAAETDKNVRVIVRRCSLYALSFRPTTAAVITALNIQGALHPCCLHFISSLHNQLVIGRANESTVKPNSSIIHSGTMQLLLGSKEVSAVLFESDPVIL